MTWLPLAGLALVLITGGLLVALTFLQRKSPARFRHIPAFERLNRAIGLSVEDGTRLHFSLGRGDILSMNSAAGLTSLAVLRRIAQQTAISDKPSVSTSGDGVLAILSRDTIESAFQSVGAAEQYQPTSGQVSGLTPFSYAAGAISVIRSGDVSANIILGHLGAEAALLSDAAERENTFLLASSDNLPAQSVLFVAADQPLIGEELYASGAYVKAGTSHLASLTIQDILRWLIVLVLLGGMLLKLAGVL
jgi:hypothetical protein